LIAINEASGAACDASAFAREVPMFDFVGTHFIALVLTMFGLFACVMGGVSIIDATRR
jgi:hypothetical protein